MTNHKHSEGSVSGDALQSMLDGAERFAKRKFFHRPVLETILRLTEPKRQLRDDFFFFATFVANASQVLSRQGTGSTETEKLLKEFSDSMEKAHELLRTIVKEADEGQKQNIVSVYLTLSPDAMRNILALFREVAWIKSYEIETKER